MKKELREWEGKEKNIFLSKYLDIIFIYPYLWRNKNKGYDTFKHYTTNTKPRRI